jgi:hypothetical protein
MTTSLFKIEGDITALEMLLDEDASVDQHGEINGHLARWIEESEGQFEDKVENYCGLMAELTALADVRKLEVQRLQALEQATRKKAERLKTVLRDVLQRLGRQRVETVRYVCRLQKAGGAQPMLVDEFSIPDEFMAVVKSPDRAAIRAALESGKTLTFAALMERSTILVIK